MNNALLQLKIKERLNKLSSMDYDNIECWQVVEAFNKAQLEWVRKQAHGFHAAKTGKMGGAESSTTVIDDLQILLKSHTFTSVVNRGLYFESAQTLPADYLFFNRINTDALTDCCPARVMSVYLVPVADVDTLLGDQLRNPNLEWAETFATMSSNKIQLYTNNKFTISHINLHYFRKPVPISIVGCADPSTGTISTVDIPCEFKDDIAEMIADDTASILAGDIESITQYQRNKQNSTDTN
jgi:hypothetical protein